MVDVDKSFILFSSVVIEIASKKFNAGVSHEEAEPFVKALYEKYIGLNLPQPDLTWISATPKSAKAWVADELEGKFTSYGQRPRWLHEPSWRYLNGVPMSFVHQFSVEAGGDDYYGGVMTYVFFGRSFIGEEDWELVVKMIQQDEDEAGSTFL